MSEDAPTAGPLDFAALIDASAKPFDLLDPELAAKLESQANKLAGEQREITLARALVLVGHQHTEVWSKYTAETNAHSESRSALNRANTEIAALHAQTEIAALKTKTSPADDAVRKLVARLDAMNYAELARHDSNTLIAQIHAELRALVAG